VGDQVLKMLASHLDKTGGGGRAYRYGGEEFVLVFEHKSLQQVKPYLEKLRQNVANYPMRIRGQGRPKDAQKGARLRKKISGATDLSVTISLGAAHRSESLKTPLAVMEAADKALYRAKKAGRNRVILY
jgi:PleD family two-component response regulator